METIGVIPARYAATRFEGKLLKDLCGKPVIQHVYERAKKARNLDELVVAADDERIVKAVKGFGGKAVLTSASHPSGTDRLTEVVNQSEARWVVNIQGDEPLVAPGTIDELLEALQKDPRAVMASVVKKSSSAEEFKSRDVVKAVLDHDDYALYFSRAPIPSALRLKKDGEWFYKHIGLYAYSKEFLFTFKKLPVSYLEKNEKLEQLRALENGYRIKMIETSSEMVGVDTPEDLERVRALMKKTEGRLKHA